MYCPKCGNEVSDEAVLCPKCGCLLPGKSLPKTKNVTSEKTSILSDKAINISLICMMLLLAPVLCFSMYFSHIATGIFSIICFLFVIAGVLTCVFSLSGKNKTLEPFKHLAIVLVIIFSFVMLVLSCVFGGFGFDSIINLILIGAITTFEIISLFASKNS